MNALAPCLTTKSHGTCSPPAPRLSTSTHRPTTPLHGKAGFVACTRYVALLPLKLGEASSSRAENQLCVQGIEKSILAKSQQSDLNRDVA